MKTDIRRIVEESVAVKRAAFQLNEEQIVACVRLMAAALKKHRKIILFGNGGSAADSQHIAAEFVGRFQKERRALAAVALTTDTSALTALANDYGYDAVFRRQLEALGQKSDVAVGISTSGHSASVVEALRQARRMGLSTVALTGKGGGRLKSLSDVLIQVPSKVTARIQEAHICIAHTICELVEKQFSKKKT